MSSLDIRHKQKYSSISHVRLPPGGLLLLSDDLDFHEPFQGLAELLEPVLVYLQDGLADLLLGHNHGLLDLGLKLLALDSSDDVPPGCALDLAEHLLDPAHHLADPIVNPGELLQSLLLLELKALLEGLFELLEDDFDRLPDRLPEFVELLVDVPTQPPIKLL